MALVPLVFACMVHVSTVRQIVGRAEAHPACAKSVKARARASPV